MASCESFIAIASRACAKSWLIALYALAIACLYPNSEIVIVAYTKKQAGIIFGKIESLQNDYPNIKREIMIFKNSESECKCVLQNNSKIKTVICNEGGRGERATLIIGEEFRIMNKTKFDSIVRPFAIARQTPYMKEVKYSHLIEEPREILISSAYHKGLWWLDETMTKLDAMIKGESAGVLFLDYLTPIHHGIKTKKQIERDRKSFDAITFQEEYENIPFGENSNAFFKLEMFDRNKRIKKAFYPLRKDLMDKKKNPYGINRIEGEIRIVAADIATRKGSKNDNTILTCIRLIPSSKGYQREFVYMESHQGEHTGKQALRIKQIYTQFEADYIVLDLQNVGITVFEQLAVVTKDDELGIEYEAYTVFEHKSLDKSLIEELKEKTLASKALPIIYPIRGNAKLNSEIALDFRDRLSKGMISLLIDITDAEDYLESKYKEYATTLDVELKVWYLYPYAQMNEFKNETVNLEYSIVGGNIKIEEARNARKDRYSSSSYGNYVASLLEQDLLKQEDVQDFSQFMIIPQGSWT